jgi:hypothetical protein
VVSFTHPNGFTPWGKSPPVHHFVGGWVCPRAGLDVTEKRKNPKAQLLRLPLKADALHKYRIILSASAQNSKNMCVFLFKITVTNENCIHEEINRS